MYLLLKSYVTHWRGVCDPDHDLHNHVELLVVGCHPVQLRVLVSRGIPSGNNSNLILLNLKSVLNQCWYMDE